MREGGTLSRSWLTQWMPYEVLYEDGVRENNPSSNQEYPLSENIVERTVLRDRGQSLPVELLLSMRKASALIPSLVRTIPKQDQLQT